jgi:predicted transglutaminase-like protease
MSSLNIASIACLSTIGVNYVLDRMKDRKDKHLREEIKERVFDSIRENTERLRSIELELERQVPLIKLFFN